MICSSSFSLYLSLSLFLSRCHPLVLSLFLAHICSYMCTRTHTHTRSPLVHFLPLPLFLSFWHSMSVSILRRVRTNRHATHTSAHAFVHADGRNGGHKASLKTTFFFSVMLRCAPRTKRSPLPPCSVFISHSFLVRRLSYVSFSFSGANRACTFVRFPSFFLSFYLSVYLYFAGCSL